MPFDATEPKRQGNGVHVSASCGGCELVHASVVRNWEMFPWAVCKTVAISTFTGGWRLDRYQHFPPFGALAQQARALACHARGNGIEARTPRHFMPKENNRLKVSTVPTGSNEANDAWGFLPWQLFDGPMVNSYLGSTPKERSRSRHLVAADASQC